MNRWLISVPVWGERYVEEFCATALPALDSAIVRLAMSVAGEPGEVRLIVHTDQPERIAAASGSRPECRPVPAGAREFDCMSQAHREVLSTGLRGDVVVLLTAGAVISAAGLAYCAEILRNRHIKLVMCAVPRVLAAGPMPSTGDAQAFMDWAWEHRHPMTQECLWPDGCSADLSRTFFVDPHGGVVTRQALPHPLAVRIDGRPVRFTPTVDANLMHGFDPTEIHLAMDCRELALIKLSPASKGFDIAPSSMHTRASRGELVIGDPHQRWCLGHRIHLCQPRQGPGEWEDGRFIEAVR